MTKTVDVSNLIVPINIEPNDSFDVDRWSEYSSSVPEIEIVDEHYSEQYTGRIQQSYKLRGQKTMKYLTIPLPEDSDFASLEKVSVTISRVPPEEEERIPFADPERSCYEQMRNMNIGEKLQFPYDRWQDLRTCAAKLKALYEVVFTVHKMGRKVSDILVIRLA